MNKNKLTLSKPKTFKHNFNISSNQIRTHSMIFGSTGMGKTILVFGLLKKYFDSVIKDLDKSENQTILDLFSLLKEIKLLNNIKNNFNMEVKERELYRKIISNYIWEIKINGILFLVEDETILAYAEKDLIFALGRNRIANENKTALELYIKDEKSIMKLFNDLKNNNIFKILRMNHEI